MTSCSSSQPHFLLVEPYYGGSHKAFLQGVQAATPFRFTLLHLPARKWKMRMQLAAPWAAEQICELVQQGHIFAGLLASTFIDLSVLRSMLARKGIFLPMAVYFHENQFAYPFHADDVGQHQFTAINFSSAISADQLAFNSAFNRDTFLQGISRYVKKATDMQLTSCVEEIRKKSVILSPGLDFSLLDQAEQREQSRQAVIVWNHRWEHDKNPDRFFQALFSLADAGVKFQVIVLGEQFRFQPPIFAQAKERLAKHLRWFSYAESRVEYARLLKEGTLVVSTALHEFFGFSVLEAVRAGCVPVLPDRLSYCELFPKQYRYAPDDALESMLLQRIEEGKALSEKKRLALTQPYSWETLGPQYESWLLGLAAREISFPLKY